MIVELLKPENVVLDLKGDFAAAIEQLLGRSALSGRAYEIRSIIASEKPARYLLDDQAIAVPHARLTGPSAPEAILGLSRKGVAVDGHKVKVILLLTTPVEQTAEHLQLIQRLASLLPQIRDGILKAGDVHRVLKVIADGERQPGRTTYLNLTQEQVAFELQTDPKCGLTDDEARHRLLIHGRNSLEKARRVPGYLRLGQSFFSFFALLLWLAAGLCFLPNVDMPQMGFAILIVILVNGFFSYWQERKSDRAVEALQGLMALKCRAMRGGRVLEIEASELVPGDVILLDEGDLVPADARLIEASEVEVDNSALTGESTSSRRYKSDRPVLITGKFLWIELPNVVFAGTSILRGSAQAVIFGTGMHSEVGKIARLTQDIRLVDSPLQKQLRSAVLTIALLATTCGAAFLFLGWLVGGLSFVQAFIFFIGLFVANVPEGLLPTVTLALAMGVARMAKRNALVKHLPSVETLGCTTVICSDKTGTLTQNLMMVERVWVDGRVVEVDGSGYRPEGHFSINGDRLSADQLSRWPALRRLLECALICNNARLEKSEGEYRVLGDPTEGALLALAGKGGLHGAHQRLHVNPFESIRKRMSVVVRLPRHSVKTAYVKGSPLETLECCDRILWHDKVRPLTERDRKHIVAENDSFARQGLRVLGLAFRDDPELQQQHYHSMEKVETRLVFLGLASMSDPIRPQVPEAIQACHAAGIRVLVITGDHPLTAEHISRRVGLGSEAGLPTFSGTQISEMSDEGLREILVRGESVFARVTPEHKLRIVNTLKELGEVTAVTGDGVNDAPALKSADIGIAMGIRGNDVAKEAAHMILADDNFGSIVAAIEEGRAIFDNIKRFVAYILNSNPLELYPYVLWMLIPDMPLAMTVMGVLAVDVGTDLIPAIGLGMEPPEKGIMERPPRRKNEKLLSLPLILRSYLVEGSILVLSCFATYLYFGWTLGYWKPGFSPASMPASPKNLNLHRASLPYLQSLTAYFFPTVTTQIANVLGKRSWKTSLFSVDFLKPDYREQLLKSIAAWRPRPRVFRIRMDYEVPASTPVGIKALLHLLAALVAFPFAWGTVLFSRGLMLIHQPLMRPVTQGVARLLEQHPVVLNFISNPLIDLGIFVELMLCYVFFYSPLAKVYFFAPVPWHVYLFAFHGTLLLFVFTEIQKLYRRKGTAAI
ncbi:MAG: HAD-IC family P-type ATPase [Acidobacteria bacterium]|nr:HAD-IC family P-type ATPase [Acidobacteriota bacterium]